MNFNCNPTINLYLRQTEFSLKPIHKHYLSIAFFLLGFTLLLSGQNKISTEDYIEQFKDVAIQKMKEYRIPASITLAQGILESGSGNSRLARKANNHFGIKCHKGWEGKSFYMDDDEKHECFRKYKNASESYRDHSLFLTQRGRYSFLFDLEVTDYKAWAKGLKKAGYATNPKYPQLLIGIIERYDLAQYDKGVKVKKKKHRKAKEQVRVNGKNGITDSNNIYKPVTPILTHLEPVLTTETGRMVFENNGVKFIRAELGDTYYDLADEFEIYSWQLYKYNETNKKNFLQTNDIVYLEKKKKKAEKKYKSHRVQYGESLKDISQLYGVRLSSIIKMNGLESDRNVAVGTVLKLR